MIYLFFECAPMYLIEFVKKLTHTIIKLENQKPQLTQQQKNYSQ
jgi:hypothetical protein